MNENVRLLFDNLRDGLLIVTSSDLRILYANPAARQLAKLDIANGAPEWLSTRITAIQNGYLTLPLAFELHPGDGNAPSHLTCVTVLNSPVATDYIAILSRITATQDNRTAISNMAEMLDCELLRPMDDFLSAVEEMQKQLNDLPEDRLKIFSSVALVNRNAETLKDGFSQIQLMANAFKYNPIQSDDRIDLSSLIDDVLENVSRLLVARQVRVSFSGVNCSLPAIYASRRLLTHAISGYVRHLVSEIDSGVHILFSVRTNGYFALLTLNNFGRIAPTDKGGRRLPSFPGRSVTDENDGVPLSLTMCQRVIELCGGNLRLEKSEGMLTSITFELPIGSPRNKNEEYIRQAQRYAEDLASLINLKSTRNVEDK